jgi:hypothetical protein
VVSRVNQVSNPLSGDQGYLWVILSRVIVRSTVLKFTLRPVAASSMPACSNRVALTCVMRFELFKEFGFMLRGTLPDSFYSGCSQRGKDALNQSQHHASVA